MPENSSWTVIGSIGRPHGVKGWVTVHSFTEPRDNILQYTDWHVNIHGQWQPLKVVEINAHTKNIIMLIDGYVSREKVAALTNHNIAVLEAQLPLLPTGEYYWHQLINMHVINHDGQDFGVVEEILPTGSNDVLIVQGDRKRFIPYLPGEYVLHVDLIKNQINVHWDADF